MFFSATLLPNIMCVFCMHYARGVTIYRYTGTYQYKVYTICIGTMCHKYCDTPDNMMPTSRSVHCLKRDGLHLTRLGANELSEKLAKLVNPFLQSLKGPAEQQVSE